MNAIGEIRDVSIGHTPALAGTLGVPRHPRGLVIFAHGSGSSRFSPRNNYVAERLRDARFATLLLDLLTVEEERDRANVFDISLLAFRLATAAAWAGQQADLANLPIGLFGASTGAGAALRAAAMLGDKVAAVVSRGGRPDLAGVDALKSVRAPTLLIVGERDEPVIQLNESAARHMSGPVETAIVPGASHLFEEPGTLDRVVVLASGWFVRHLGLRATDSLPFADRADAGRRLAAKLAELTLDHPVVLALPRGGVPVAYEVARRLGAPLELLLVRKIGAPGHEEYGIGAVVDGSPPRRFINHDAALACGASANYLERETQRQLVELERRRRAYGLDQPVDVSGRAVILIDDGIATGATVRAALEGVRAAGAATVVLGVPVAARESLAQLASHCDQIVCLASPEPFLSVGRFYSDFTQTEDSEVVHLLDQARRALHRPHASIG